MKTAQVHLIIRSTLETSIEMIKHHEQTYCFYNDFILINVSVNSKHQQPPPSTTPHGGRPWDYADTFRPGTGTFTI